MKARAARRLGDAVVYAFLLGGLVLVLLPFAWMLSTSLKTLPEIFRATLSFLPRSPQWGNYLKVWHQLPFGAFYLNSLAVSGAVTLLQVFLGSLAAFAFARLRFPGRDKLFVVYLAAMMIPSQVTLIPNFLLVRTLGGIDHYWGIILPQAFSVFSVFLLRQFFLGIPRSLEEAALIDGAGNFRVYATIIMPLAKPGLAALGVFAFMFSWNNFLWPLVVSYKEAMFTLPLGLLSFQGQYATDFPLMMSAACQAMLPVVALYAIAQRSFIEGVTVTGLANL